MQGLLFTAALLAAGLVGFGNFGMRAQDTRTQGVRSQDYSVEQGPEQAGVFDRWLKPNAPECVPVSDIASVSRLTKLTPAQFQFVRALYIAIPPVSRELPPGDSAIVASADGKAMIAACIRRRDLRAVPGAQFHLVDAGSGGQRREREDRRADLRRTAPLISSAAHHDRWSADVFAGATWYGEAEASEGARTGHSRGERARSPTERSGFRDGRGEIFDDNSDLPPQAKRYCRPRASLL